MNRKRRKSNKNKMFKRSQLSKKLMLTRFKNPMESLLNKKKSLYLYLAKEVNPSLHKPNLTITNKLMNKK